jgi:hypothetical protein
MTTLKRLAALEARAKPSTRPGDFLAQARAMLDKEVGPDPSPRRGETLFDEMRRRVQSLDGWDLSGIPGATLGEKEANCDAVAAGTMTASAEAKHAARHWLEIHSC